MLQNGSGNYRRLFRKLKTRSDAITVVQVVLTRFANLFGRQRHGLGEAALLRALIAASRYPMFWKDRAGVYFGCNPLFARDTGLSHPGEIVGKTDFYLPYTRHEAERYRTRDSAGQVIGVVGVYLDVTEQKRFEGQLRRSEELFRAVTENTTDAVFVKDAEGRYLLINTAGARFLGRDAAEILGKRDDELFDAASAAALADRDRRVLAGGCPETEEETLTASGVRRDFSATKAAWRDPAGNVLGLVGVSRDVSDRKRSEEEVRGRGPTAVGP